MLPLLALLSLQAAVDEAMRGVAGAAVVIEIATGKVAAASGEAEDRASTPGSAIKPFVAEIVLGSVRTPPPLRCGRKLRIAGRSFACTHPALATALDVPAAISYSCNSAFAALAMAVPPEKLTARLREFGFTVEDPRTEDTRRLLALGEGGVRISPRGLARAYAKLAQRHDPRVAEGMRGAVEFGSAQLAAVPGLEIAGKTGTSANSWFAGWAPAGQPRFAIAVLIAGGRGGGTAAPVAAKILREIAPRPDNKHDHGSSGHQRQRIAGSSRAAKPSRDRQGAVFEPCVRCLDRGAPSGERFSNAVRAAGSGKWLQGSGRAPRGRSRPAPRRAPMPANQVTVQLFRDKRILAMDLEDYVDGVLGGEAAGLSSEAMKAIAVAARTYAVANRGRHKSEGFDFCESTHCQDLRLGGRSETTRAAVEATWGELLWYAGSPARVYYTGDCGGTSEAVGEVWSGVRAPYLTQQSDPACVRRGTARWRYDLEAREFSVVRRSASGRALQVRVDGRTMPFEEFARATGFAVKSPLFQVSRAGAKFVLDGKGTGHGIGLCQSGAEARSRAGESYERILGFYYPGTRTGITAQGLSWKRFHAPKLEVWAIEEPRALMDPALRALRQAESGIGGGASEPMRIRVFPSLGSFRDSTGEPGWVAASTVAGVIRLQPVDALSARGALEPVLLHEFLHVLVTRRTRAPVPRWFEEGLVCYLAEASKPAVNVPLVESHIARPPDDRAMRAAYEAARSKVKRLADAHGRPAVLSWLERGIPDAIARSNPAQAATATK